MRKKQLETGKFEQKPNQKQADIDTKKNTAARRKRVRALTIANKKKAKAAKDAK